MDKMEGEDIEEKEVPFLSGVANKHTLPVKHALMLKM